MNFQRIKYFFFISFIISLSQGVSAQSRNVIGVYKPVQSKHIKGDRIPFSTKQLAFSITRNARTDSEKAYAIYKWITQNIAYDNELMRSENLQNRIYTSEENVVKNVINRKMALCGGFALLYKSLCEDVGIQAEAVNGFTKDFTGRLKERKIPNHTWNVVKLNGKWQLLDITWAIGHGIKNAPDEFWYLTKPKDFIYSHYPENPKWTLLEDYVSFSEFQNKG